MRMKKGICGIVWTALALFAGVSAYAGNEGPTAAAPEFGAGGKVIAQVESQGGFVPAPLSGRRGIRVYSSGVVTSFRNEKEEVLARLSGNTRGKLQAEINQVHGGELVDYNPEAPRCADAPMTKYVVFHSDGYDLKDQEIEIARHLDCHQLFLKNGQGALILQVLEGLEKLDVLN